MLSLLILVLGSNPQNVRDDDYLTPLAMPTITTSVSASVPPRQGQYETVDDIPSTTDTTPVSASLPPRQRQYEIIDDIPSTAPVSAELPPGTTQYETVQDMATTSRIYNSTSLQDVEPLNVYQDLERNHLTSSDLGSCESYSNIPGQHGETFTSPAIAYANVDMSSTKGNSQNKKVTKQAYQNVEMK